MIWTLFRLKRIKMIARGTKSKASTNIKMIFPKITPRWTVGCGCWHGSEQRTEDRGLLVRRSFGEGGEM